MSMLELAPAGMVPTAQTPVTGLYVPWSALCDAWVSPVGSRSVTSTPVASADALELAMVMVKVTRASTVAEATSTVLVSDRSAATRAKTDAWA